MVSMVFEHFARLSVFIAVARYDEMTSQHDPHHHHFEQLLDRLESDAEGGLYTVMCAVDELFRSLASNQSEAFILQQRVVDEIRAMSVYQPHNHALRHVRDYTVVTYLRRVAQRLADDVRQLTQQR